MALSESDMKRIDDRAELIAERVVEKVITRVITVHQSTCPHGRWVNNTKRLLIGIGIGVAVMTASSAFGSVLASLMIKIL